MAMPNHSTSSRLQGTETTLRACRAALSAIDPVAVSAVVLDPDSDAVPDATKAVERKDEPTLAFLARQLRLLMEHVSGQIGEV